MTNTSVKVMLEALCILAIATKEINGSRASEFIPGEWMLLSRFTFGPETFLKKLMGRKDIEDALQRLEKVTREEARMAAVEALNTLHGVGDKVMDVDYKMHGVQSTLQAIDARIKVFEELLQGEDRGKDIRDKTIDGANAVTNLIISNSLNIYSLRC